MISRKVATITILAFTGASVGLIVGHATATPANPPVDRVIAAAQQWSQPMDAQGSVIIDAADALNGWSPYDAVGMFTDAMTGADFCKAVGPLTPDAHFRVTCFNVHPDGTVQKAANTRVNFAWQTIVYNGPQPARKGH